MQNEKRTITPNIWWKQEKKSIAENIKSLHTFFTRMIDKNPHLMTILSKNKDAYPSSLYHFLLYYCSSPYSAFLTSINTTIFYGLIIGKKSCTVHLCSPTYSTSEQFLSDIIQFLNTKAFTIIRETYNVTRVIIRDVNEQIIRQVQKNGISHAFQLVSSKQIPYMIYDLRKTLSLKGPQFSNIRWHLNKFSRSDHTVRIRTDTNIETPLLHLIGKWRRQAIQERGFSFVDVHSDKYGAYILGLLSDWSDGKTGDETIFLNTHHLFYRILEVDGQISSFHLGYKLGFFNESTTFAHVIGITDLTVLHLSEYAQIDFWSYISSKGIRYVNDGPSWRKSLEMFKNKFRPIEKIRYYWMTISLD